MFYLYQHIRPDTKAVFYVGKGTSRRSQERQGRNRYWHRVVNKAGGFDVQIVFQDSDEHLILFAEEELIDKYRRMNIQLTNQTNGGEGISGFKLSEETKQKLRVLAVNRTNRRKGFKHTEETKQKLRAKAIGRPNGMKGRKHNLETINKMKEKAKQRKRLTRSWEAIEKTIAFHTGRKRSLETRIAISEAKKGKPQNYCWITNESINKKMLKNSELPVGWRLGRIVPKLSDGKFLKWT